MGDFGANIKMPWLAGARSVKVAAHKYGCLMIMAKTFFGFKFPS